jgi:hypothetical protein
MMQRSFFSSAFLLLCLPGLAVTGKAQMVGQPGCAAQNDPPKITTTSNKPDFKPVPGKALLVVLQNDDLYNPRPRPTNLIGLDGALVGATHGRSYFVVEAEPGVHHLCTSWLNTSSDDLLAAALQVELESGGVYYVQIVDMQYKLIDSPSTGLQLLDPDQGELMRRAYDLAVMKPAK